MKELYAFNDLLGNLNEQENFINANDFGMFQNLGDKSFITDLSYLETGMAEILGDVMAHGVSQMKAKTLVDGAIKELMNTKVIPELPSEEDCDGKKAMWINMARPRIIAHLRMNGQIM